MQVRYFQEPVLYSCTFPTHAHVAVPEVLQTTTRAPVISNSQKQYKKTVLYPFSNLWRFRIKYFFLFLYFLFVIINVFSLYSGFSHVTPSTDCFKYLHLCCIYVYVIYATRKLLHLVQLRTTQLVHLHTHAWCKIFPLFATVLFHNLTERSSFTNWVTSRSAAFARDIKLKPNWISFLATHQKRAADYCNFTFRLLSVKRESIW